MAKFMYKTKGTCSSEIIIEVDGDTIKSVQFLGGCSGNTQGVAKLSEGQNIDDIIEKLSGIRCGFKATSCPDQLAKALKEIKSQSQCNDSKIKQLNFKLKTN